MVQVPELDGTAYRDADSAHQRIVKGQRPILDEAIASGFDLLPCHNPGQSEAENQNSAL